MLRNISTSSVRFKDWKIILDSRIHVNQWGVLDSKCITAILFDSILAIFLNHTPINAICSSRLVEDCTLIIWGNGPGIPCPITELNEKWYFVTIFWMFLFLLLLFLLLLLLLLENVNLCNSSWSTSSWDLYCSLLGVEFDDEPAPAPEDRFCSFFEWLKNIWEVKFDVILDIFRLSLESRFCSLKIGLVPDCCLDLWTSRVYSFDWLSRNSWVIWTKLLIWTVVRITYLRSKIFIIPSNL